MSTTITTESRAPLSQMDKSGRSNNNSHSNQDKSMGNTASRMTENWDSFESSGGSIPRYSLHGLAESQSQTQLVNSTGEDEEMLESSQKENIDASPPIIQPSNIPMGHASNMKATKLAGNDVHGPKPFDKDANSNTKPPILHDKRHPLSHERAAETRASQSGAVPIPPSFRRTSTKMWQPESQESDASYGGAQQSPSGLDMDMEDVNGQRDESDLDQSQDNPFLQRPASPSQSFSMGQSTSFLPPLSSPSDNESTHSQRPANIPPGAMSIGSGVYINHFADPDAELDEELEATQPIVPVQQPKPVEPVPVSEPIPPPAPPKKRPSPIPQPSKPSSRTPAPVQSTSEEIVPDSEPPMSLEDEGTFSKPDKHPTPERRRAGGRRAHQSLDIVPDSMDVEPGSQLQQGPVANKSDEDEDDEDDIPLATVQSKSRKAAEAKPPSSRRKKIRKDTKESDTTPIAAPRSLGKRQREAQSDMVPSSVPSQDDFEMPQPGSPPKQETKRPTKRRKTNSVDKPPTSRKSSKGKGKASPRKQKSVSPTENEEDEDDEGDELNIKNELLTDALMKASTLEAARNTRRVPSSVPPSRSGKTATRVFALWKQNKSYYPGTVNRFVSPDRWMISFDDGQEGMATIDQMRYLDLRAGEKVFSSRLSFVFKKFISGVNPSSTMQVTEEDGDTNVLAIEEIMLGPRTCDAETWNDRRISKEDIVTEEDLPPKSTSRDAPASAVQARRTSTNSIVDRIFSGYGILVTGIENSAKTSLLAKIEQHDGQVVEDWEEILHAHAHDRSDRRTFSREDLEISPSLSFDTLVLVADAFSQTSKFLIAVALGVPCVSSVWVKDSITKKDVQPIGPYLLPQGQSDYLDTQISQSVDLRWADSSLPAEKRKEKLLNMLTSPIPSKLFKDMSILMVGTDLVANKNTDKNSAYLTLPLIVLAMGAKVVEAVKTLPGHEKLMEFNFVITHNPQTFKRHAAVLNTLEGTTVRSWEWVKDSLISRIFVPPKSSRENSRSSSL